MFTRALRSSIDEFLADPLGAPLVPNWARVWAGVPDAGTRLMAAVQEGLGDLTRWARSGGMTRRRGRPLLVATDLDGCLLDASYSYEAARPGARRPRARAACRSCCAAARRAAEMESLVRVLGLDSPFIVENGGAIVIPTHQMPRVPGEPGVRPALYRDRAGDAAQGAGRGARGDLGRGRASTWSASPASRPSELERLTGLSTAAAEQALCRAFDEPFLAEGGSDAAAAIAREASKRGLRVTRGGRFHHLTGHTDKGEALRRLIGVFAAAGRLFRTAALGDAANDLSMLQTVDRPVVVPLADGRLDAVLAAALPQAERAPAPGPPGWNEAVMAVLQGRRLPTIV